MTFILATNNPDKLREMNDMISGYGHKCISLDTAGIYAVPDETGATFAENAKIKASEICKKGWIPTIADDSGLEVDALGGRPGVFSARYAGEGADSEKLTEKLLGELENVPDEKRTARFVCAMCAVMKDGRRVEAQGVCEGTIARERRGDGGFGYDPVFVDPVSGLTFAQMSAQQKNKISHRAKAIANLMEKIGG